MYIIYGNIEHLVVISWLQKNLFLNIFNQNLIILLLIVPHHSKYLAAEQDQLWSFLTVQAHADGTLAPDNTVKRIMDTWTLQMGYPVVTVTRSAEGTEATVKQVISMIIHIYIITLITQTVEKIGIIEFIRSKKFCTQYFVLKFYRGAPECNQSNF